MVRVVILIACCLMLVGTARAQPAEWAPGELLILPAPRGIRTPFRTDPVQLEVAAGTWKAPAAGDEVGWPGDRARTWRSIAAQPDGWFADQALGGGYAFALLESESAGPRVLEASGHTMVHVNGEPRVGDVYSLGYVRLPIQVRKGRNEFLFHAGRGRLRARLVPPTADVELNLGDATLPDLVQADTRPVVAGVIVTNTTDRTLRGLHVVTREASDGQDTASPLPNLPPFSVSKVPIRLQPATPPAGESRTFEILVFEGGATGSPVTRATVELRVRSPHATRKVTFISAIDGSVQYYGLTPRIPLADSMEPSFGLVLTLHGASVEGLGQAAAYKPKEWCDIVAPTNRRPYGFDWEDWGRLDAMEVLRLASEEFKPDPSRIYLTGHSMGGHGTWQVGAHFSDRFAAIAPSAGWVSFWSYTGAENFDNAGPVEKILKSAHNASDTLALARNYRHHGVYILHGDADDNVPVGQARAMRTRLAEDHPDFAYFEQPGAGHWWGDECVDWPPLFEFLRRHRRPESVDHVEFVTASPAVSAACRWVTIEQPRAWSDFARIDVTLDRAKRAVRGETTNIARLTLDLSMLGGGEPPTIALDGQELKEVARPADGAVHLKREGDEWKLVEVLADTEKGPHRAGPFKTAFTHRPVLVYATRGTPEENAWTYAKARYDSESFWYRGNCAFEVVSDGDFLAGDFGGRGVILYGHADCNGAWESLLADSPVVVRRSSLRVGDRELKGEEWSILFVRPRAGSAHAMVGVVGGTGMPGMITTLRVPYFSAGVGFPDWTVFSPAVFERGLAGVEGAGFFGNDWALDAGQSAWRE